MKQIQLFTFFFVLILGSSITAQTQDAPDPSELKLRVIERFYNDVSDIDKWEVTVTYPELRLEGDRPAPGFSDYAKQLVMKEVADFKNDVKDAIAEMPEPRSHNLYQVINFETHYLDDGLISVRFSHSEFMGGAHPNHWSFVVNYDLKNDRKIELGDLFKDGSGFLDVISKKSIKDILAKSPDGLGDWPESGAGPALKNFASWNITKQGLLFTFDPYQVGPYAAGRFESIVPFKSFTKEMEGPMFYSAQTATYIDGSPPNWCRGGRWTMREEPFALANVMGRKNTRAYFYDDADDCPDGENCRRKSYIVAGDEVIVQREYGDYSCVWYQPSKGFGTVGWLKTSGLRKKVQLARPPRNWVGDWVYGDNSIEIKQSKSGKLSVYGTALWRGLGDNVHVGEIDFLGVPELDILKVGDGSDNYDCNVTLRRLGRYLIVSDNLHCGGANVSFNGVYLSEERKGSLKP